MNGAREYCKLFTTGQYGKLWIKCGSHARGKTFHIYIIPDGRVINDRQYFRIEGSVKVYGVTGNVGWTEIYGWLHRGPWINDFYKLVAERKEIFLNKELAYAKKKLEADKIEKERVRKLLDQY